MVIRPGGGEVIGDSPERRVEILSDHPSLHATWSRFGPGRDGADLHVHREHTDLFYVLEGEFTLRLGPQGEPRPLTAGTLAWMPPGVVHGFRNASDAELRFLNFHAPGCGFADYLRGKGDFDQEPPPGDGGRPLSDAIVTPPGGGERFRRDDRAVTILGECPELSAFLLEVDPEWQGIGAHDHSDEVDTFFVLEGETGFAVGEEVVRAAPGAFYGAPPGVRHGVAHSGGRAAFLNVHGPDVGFADWVRTQ